MSEYPYIIAAYVTSWVVITGFAIYLVLRGRSARARLANLSPALRRED